MAKSYKQSRTKEKFSKDVVNQQRKKERQFGKELANNYIEDVDESEEEEYEYNYARE